MRLVAPGSHRTGRTTRLLDQHGNEAAEHAQNTSARDQLDRSPPISISTLDLNFASQLQQPEVVGLPIAGHPSDHLQLDEPLARSILPSASSHIVRRSHFANSSSSLRLNIAPTASTSASTAMCSGRYEMETSLRAAIFGEILLCRDRLSGERVVVKTVDLQLALQQTSHAQRPVQENVLHEVEVLNRVRTLGGHPNVINMHSYFVAKDGGVLHMVLDYCEGGDLLDACVQPPVAEDQGDKTSSNSNSSSGNSLDNQKEDAVAARAAEVLDEHSPEEDDSSNGPFLNGVDGSKRLQESVAHTYLVDVLSGLRFLHSHGIAHRDVSLENILLRDGHAVITDFGLCVQDVSLSGSPTGSVFRCEETVGKNYYMAPEVVARERYDPRQADIWSVGIAFFILLTSSPPFERAEPSDPGFRYVAKRGIKAVFTAWGLGEEVSEPMQDLLARMLCVDPEERITMEEIWQHPLLQRPRCELPVES
ncbi:hypothetical protein V7S43_004931 [Phytophthora oleae]|uniref:Protein kinase domain-containing protein n=1 Tax=Phytophthora oleae TaxID=2107226 RepID=A0ABD3FRQ5_9STRA